MLHLWYHCRCCTLYCVGYGIWRVGPRCHIAALCMVFWSLMIRMIRYAHGQLLHICGLFACTVCDVHQAASCMPHANSSSHAHACACTHEFAHPLNTLTAAGLAVIYGIGPLLWDQATWRLSSSVVPVWAIVCECFALRTVTCTADVNTPLLQLMGQQCAQHDTGGLVVCGARQMIYLPYPVWA